MKGEAKTAEEAGGPDFNRILEEMQQIKMAVTVAAPTQQSNEQCEICYNSGHGANVCRFPQAQEMNHNLAEEVNYIDMQGVRRQVFVPYKKPMEYGDRRLLSYSNNNYENYVPPAPQKDGPNEPGNQVAPPKDDLAGKIKSIVENSDRFYKQLNQIQEKNDRRFEVLENSVKRIENMVGELMMRSLRREQGRFPM